MTMTLGDPGKNVAKHPGESGDFYGDPFRISVKRCHCVEGCHLRRQKKNPTLTKMMLPSWILDSGFCVISVDFRFVALHG